MNSSSLLISSILGLAGGIVTLIFLTLYKGENPGLTKTAALLTTTQALQMIFSLVFMFAGWMDKFSGLYWTTSLTSSVFMLYLLKSCCRKNTFKDPKSLSHLITLLFAITASIFFVIPDFTFASFVSHEQVERVLLVFSTALIILYFFFAVKEYKNYYDSIHNIYSSINYYATQRLFFLIVALFLVVCLSIFSAAIFTFASPLQIRNLYPIASLLRVIPLYGFYVLVIALVAAQPLTIVEDNKDGYFTHNTISFKELYSKTKELIIRKKLYLEPDIDIIKVAAILKCTPCEIVNAIKGKTGGSFYYFVNTIRAKKSIEMLNDPISKSFPFVTIACQAGFSSEIAFNRVFKKVTGMKPNDYRRKQEQG
ncbi:MAG: helix-turn-helix transcriptional regulator [Spirochaetes bacterium]|nr:helix-turn-helix transcriptional regulator [Spirochaetota bacterium]MBN2770857.1 helix-turn-helix transcriptional regulator [Spirochaetota bacterium]